MEPLLVFLVVCLYSVADLNAQLLSNVTVTPIDSTRLSVTWTPLTQYQSREFDVTVSTQLLGNGYCDNTTGSLEVIGPVTTKPATIPVNNLRSYSRYNVSLLVKMTGSTLQDVVTQVVMTRAVAPTGQVTLSVVQVTKGSVEITWTELSCPERKGTDLFYYVKLFITNSPQMGFLADNVHGNRYSWDTLKSNMNYTIRVSAVNEVGQGPYSEVNVQTLQQGPDSIEIKNLTSTYSSVQLMYQTALTTGQLVYQIAYSLSSQFTSYTTVRTSSSGNLTIDGLTANTTYYFKVCAIENNIPGPYGSSKQILTVELITIDLDNLTADCVGFTWTPPSSRLNTWTYKMALEKINLTSDLSVLQTSVYTCGLVPSTLYTIKITAYSSGTLMTIGVRNFTSAEHKPPPAPPEPVYLRSTNTSLTVRLEPVVAYSSLVSLYQIRVEKINMVVRKREAGVNSYLSAQLQASAFNSTREFTVGDGKVWGGVTNQELQNNQYYMVYFVVVSTVGSSTKTNSSQLPQPVFTVPYERDAARNLTIVSFSTSSMCVNLTWLPPAEYKLILTKYMIQMSSTSNIQQQLPSVTLSPAVSEYGTCQLRSGTDYVMTLRGFGGSWVVSYFNLTFKTERQPVPPAPEPPTFLRSDYTTITVNIRPVISPAVRITQYQIKVEKLTTATTRPEAGVPGYVATEYLTDAFTKQETFVVGDGKTYGQYLNKALEANVFYNIHIVSMFVTNDSTTYNWTTTPAFAAPYEANKPLTLSATQISRTVTCLEVAWSSPDQMASVLTSFNIESVSISNKSEPKTSETLAPSDRSHQICQLRSASQYNVTISGFARPWVVALGSGIFSTGAHTNPPAPPPPVLITSTSTTIKVAIEPVTSSSSAPITSYVLMVKSLGTRQKRLAGVQGYETAELQPQDVTTRREFTIGGGAMWGSYRNKPLERYTEYLIYFVTVSAIPDSTTYSFSSMSEPVLTPLLDVSITSSTDVTLAFRNETCLNVTWQVPPEAASIITSFQIQFGKTGADTSFITRNLTQNYRNVFFCGLLYYTNYTTVIKAFVGQIVLYTSSAVFSTLHDKPPVPAAPVLVNSTNTSITVTLRPVQSPSAPVTSYIVVIDKVSSTSSRQKRAIAFTVGNTTAELKSSELTKPLDFTIGDGGVYGGIVNRPLDPATFYNVYFVALSVFGGVTKYSFTKLSTPVKTVFYVAPKMIGEGGGSSGEVIGIVVGCLILVALVLAATAGYIFWRRKHKQVNKKESEQFPAPRSNDDISLYNNITLTPTDLIQESPKSGEGKISWNLSPLKEQSLKLPEQPAIKMPEQFWSKTYSFQENRFIIKEGRNGKIAPNQNVYNIPEATENEISISDEFLQLRTKHRQAVTSVAYLNKDLNRFPRLLPYDHSLVKLVSDASSDSNYINASFMPGYMRAPVYIAAQSPYDPVTVLDFWRLIYQRSLKTIVMLTNLREGRIVKCSQYWPDVSEDTLGHLTIRVMSVQVYADYTLRTLGVRQTGEDFHVVQQFQYTSWPEHGAPDDPIPLLDMLYKVRAHHSKDPTPILVHCGTGIGRSGVYIAIDTLIEQFQEEGSVNVFQCVHKMRKDRPFMVRTLKEYVFIYAALHENFFAGATTFGREFKSVINNWRRKNPETGKTFLEEQFECLQMPPMKSCIKGLNQDISSQVSLDFSSSSSSSYSSSSWNVHNPFSETVSIDGLLEPGQYKLTNCSQFTNPRDFVHFLLHNNIATIMAFRDSQTVPFIEKHRLRDFNMVVCQPPKENILNNFVVTDIVVSNVTVRLFEVNAGMASNEVKFTETMMANLIAEVFAWRDDKRREAVLVTGARFPEIFIPLALFCEKIKMDKSGDLFKIIRHCKYNNLQCQFNYDQYIYCYKTIWTFMRKFLG